MTSAVESNGFQELQDHEMNDVNGGITFMAVGIGVAVGLFALAGFVLGWASTTHPCRC